MAPVFYLGPTGRKKSVRGTSWSLSAESKANGTLPLSFNCLWLVDALAGWQQTLCDVTQLLLIFLNLCLFIDFSFSLSSRPLFSGREITTRRRPAKKKKGPRGLEVRGHGAGPSFPLDIYSGRPGRNGCHHSTGAFALRRPRAHRPATV